MIRLRRATRATFRSLQTRNFRLFFFGQLVSQAGTWMQSVAIIWVVLQLTDNGLALGLVTAAQFLPILLFGAWAGVISDRVDRHRFMLATQIAFTVLASVFAVLMFTDRLTVPLIYALSTVFGLLTALDNPARRALVAELVAEDDVPNAVGLNSAVMTGSRVVGPAIAGALLAGPGAAWCFAINAITYLAVIAALARMNRSAFRAAPRVARAKGQLREGFRYVWRIAELRLSLLLLAVVGVFAFNYAVTLPLFAERTLHGDAGTFTLLFSAMSAGSVVGALLIARQTTVDIGFLVRGGAWLTVSSVALALSPTTHLAVLAALPVGFATMFLISGSNAIVQLTADPSMRGRALALTAVVFLGSTPIGGPIVGWVSEELGPPAGLLLGAIATGVATAWTARQIRLQRARRPAEQDPAVLTKTSAAATVA